MTDRICSVEDCEKQNFSTGLCSMHYARLRRNGTTELTRIFPSTCTVEGCDRKYCRNGYCDMHSHRMSVYGQLAPTMKSGSLHHAWKGHDVSYRAAHARVCKARGRAADHQCVDCDGPAAQWSYNNSGVDELTKANGMRYSSDLNQYEPRCRPCHKRFDMTAKRVSA